jgi:Uma2 family endonuclease
MTAELLDEVTLRMPLSRGWTWDELQRLPEHDGHRYEIIDGSLQVSASPTPGHQPVAGRLRPEDLAPVVEVEVESPFRVEVRPAELVGPRQRG